MPKVHLDFGHGGKDPGAIGNELQEKDIALSIGLKVGNILKRHNIDVTYSRTTDTFVGLTDRAIMANDNNADVFVSIHANSATNATGQGVETYYYPNSKEGKRLAQNIQDSIIKSELYTRDRGIKEGNFAVLRHTKMPSVLVELGFISNAEDIKILINKQEELAIAVAKGLLDYLGISYKKETINNNNITSPWAGDAWEWAKNERLLDGNRPKDPLTREEFAVVLKKLKEGR